MTIAIGSKTVSITDWKLRKIFDIGGAAIQNGDVEFLKARLDDLSDDTRHFVIGFARLVAGLYPEDDNAS